MKPPILIECEQNTPAWDAARLGYITASGIGKLFTAGGKLADNATSRAYLEKLARARIFGVPDRERSCWQFERGHTFEPLARAAYESHVGTQVKQTGFWLRDLTGDGHRLGASPDGLVGEGSIIEIKTRVEAEQWSAIMSNKMPEDVMPQVQAVLLATGTEWCHYISYCNGMHLFVKTVTRDSEWQERIVEAVKAGEEYIRTASEKYRAATIAMPLAERIADANSDFSSLQ